MTIIVFLIDTSASMNQRAYLGGRPTLLDVAKGAVETFVKVRAVSSTRQKSFLWSICLSRVIVLDSWMSFCRFASVLQKAEGTGICF